MSVSVLDYNSLNFGQVFTKTEKQIVFTLVNHSSNCYRFSWPSDVTNIKFSPQEGHIHASCSKDITATFVSEEPTEIEKQQVYMKAELIEFLVPIEEVWNIEHGLFILQNLNFLNFVLYLFQFYVLTSQRPK